MSNSCLYEGYRPDDANARNDVVPRRIISGSVVALDSTKFCSAGIMSTADEYRSGTTKEAALLADGVSRFMLLKSSHVNPLLRSAAGT